MKVYWVAGAAVAVYLVVAWFATGALHLDSSRFLLLFLVLAVIGLAAAAIGVWLYKRSRDSSSAVDAAGSGGADDEIDALLREAESRLAAAGANQKARLRNLPIVFVLGETGSTKTSTILNSGLDPELLAGKVYQDNSVAPTPAANIWFAHGMVFVEAGGALIANPGRLAHLVARLRPARVASAVGASQAVRAVILCVDVETFSLPGAAGILSAASRHIQSVLGSIASLLGIRFPVYVLFTKMNRIAFFEDFVRNMSPQEVTQILGSTLPMRQATGIYAEEETARLTGAFDEVFHSLAAHRLEYLPRETDPSKLTGAYEFPREFRKLRNLLVTFLVDTCRPSQLQAGPFLRGFYFSGVRPVIVEDAPVVARPSAAQTASAASATGVFRNLASSTPAAPIASRTPGGRKVPQWIFLGQFFDAVVRRDEAALRASTSSTQASTLRRALLGVAAALMLIFAAGATVSFLGNRELEQEVLSAAKDIPAAEAGGMNLPSLTALQKLDALRATLVKLRKYEREGAPFRLRWFLYTGSELYPQARRVYYSRFHQLLFAQTQANMLTALESVQIPPGPNDDYGATYDTLKAYLMTTAEWKRSSNWLSPVLLSRWTGRRQVDQLVPLARLQFDFYSEDLAGGNPFTEKNEATAIDRARIHLSRFSGIEQIYQFMLSDASRRARTFNFNEQFPGSAEVVINNRDVPGAFTRAGWAAMQEDLGKVDKFFGGERWVLGDYAAAKPDSTRIQDELRARYTSDYIARWRDFIRNTSVTRYQSLKDAARKLNTLSGAQTPLLALFWSVTQNTAVDSPKVLEAFDAVHKVVPPPATTVQYVLPPNQEYMASLAALQTAVGQLSDQTGPPDPNRAMPARQSADAARNIVKKMGYTFRIDQEVHLETMALKLLEAPIDSVEALTKGLGAGEVNARARQFCQAFSALSAKFPFNPAATAEATVPEVDAIFRPVTGQLWVFHAEQLSAFLQKQGAQYAPTPGAAVQLTPQFVGFFNNAARFSEALYPGGVTEPALRYTLAAQPSDQIGEMTATIDGQTAKGTAPRQYTWPGAATRNVKISARLAGGSDFEFQNRDGLWSVFRFFADADRWTPGQGGYLLEWVVRQGREGRPVTVAGRELTYRFLLNTNGAAPVFQKDFLNSLRCVSQAAR